MKSTSRIRKRQRRCYELAMKVMLDESGAEHFTLVHGHLLQQPFGHQFIDHAWIETGDGRIYDPVHNAYYQADQYMATRRAVIERRYTKFDAARMSVEAGHYGPWYK